MEGFEKLDLTLDEPSKDKWEIHNLYNPKLLVLYHNEGALTGDSGTRSFGLALGIGYYQN